MQRLFDIFPIRVRAGQNVWFVIDSVEDAIDFVGLYVDEPETSTWRRLYRDLVAAAKQSDRWRIAACLQLLRRMTETDNPLVH